MLTFLTNLYCPKAYNGLIIRYVSLNIAEKSIIIPKPSIFTKTRTQGSFRVYDLSSCNLAETNKFCLGAVLLSRLVTDLQKPSSSGLEPTTFSAVWPFFCNNLTETNNFGLGAVLLSCLVSELQKSSSLGIEPGAFRGCGLNLYIRLYERQSILYSIKFLRNGSPYRKLTSNKEQL
jgi:hypothetical protein